MEDFDYNVLEAVVNKQHPGYKLLKLKMPREEAYYPITFEDDMFETWIVKDNDAIQVKIKIEDYFKELNSNI
jgi:hypothetical protein